MTTFPGLTTSEVYGREIFLTLIEATQEQVAEGFFRYGKGYPDCQGGIVLIASDPEKAKVLSDIAEQWYKEK